MKPFEACPGSSDAPSKSASSNIKTDSSSGYPVLSPTGTTLVSAVVAMLYQLQTKQPWKKAITTVSIIAIS